MAQLLVEPRRDASANRIARAGVRAEQRLVQKSLLDILNAERDLVEAELRHSGFDGRLKTVALKPVATPLTGRWQTRSKRTILQKKDRAILVHPDDTGWRQLTSERTSPLERFHSIVTL
jgi:hypothetical protein